MFVDILIYVFIRYVHIICVIFVIIVKMSYKTEKSQYDVILTVSYRCLMGLVSMVAQVSSVTDQVAEPNTVQKNSVTLFTHSVKTIWGE